MSQNYFAHYLDRNAGSRSERGSMSSEIVRPKLDPDQLAGLLDRNSCRRICDRENLLIRFNVFRSDVPSETFRHFTWNEDDLLAFPAFWVLDGEFQVAYILRCEIEHLANPHTSSGHELQHNPIPHFSRSEDDLVNRFLLDDFPGNWLSWSVELPEHRRITWILERGIKVELDEIEERLEVGVTALPRQLLSAFCQLGEKRDDLIRCDRGQFANRSDVLTESGEGVPVGLSRSFPPNSSCGTPDMC
jgi:hypothetical protein